MQNLAATAQQSSCDCPALRERWRQDATSALQHTCPCDSRQRRWRHSPAQHACCGSAPICQRLACLKVAVGAERGYWACWSPPNGTSAQRRTSATVAHSRERRCLAYLASSTEAAQKLARALGVSMDYLIGTFADDELGDGKPASMALVGA